MIGKLSSGQGIVGLVTYHEEKVNEGKAVLLEAAGFAVANKQVYIATFRDQCKQTRVQDYTFHASLNLPEADSGKLTTEQLKEIAATYMEGMGYSGQPYLVYQHHDRPHPHIHIVSVKVNEAGQKISDFNDFRRSMEITANLEKKYGLTIVDRDETKKKELYYREAVDLSDTKGVRAEIARITQHVKSQYKPTNLAEYRKVLAGYGVEVKAAGSEAINPKGLVYLLQEAGGQSHPIKASSLYHSATLPALEKRFERNRKTKEAYNKQPLAKTVTQVLERYDKVTVADLTAALEAKGIRLILDSNKGGVYGVSFLEQKSGLLFKGSELKRELSYAQVKEKLTEGKSQLAVSPTQLVNQAYYRLFRDHYQQAGTQSAFIERHLTVERVIDKAHSMRSGLTVQQGAKVKTEAVKLVTKKLAGIDQVRLKEEIRAEKRANRSRSGGLLGKGMPKLKGSLTKEISQAASDDKEIRRRLKRNQDKDRDDPGR